MKENKLGKYIMRRWPYITSRQRYIIEKRNGLWYNQFDKLKFVQLVASQSVRGILCLK